MRMPLIKLSRINRGGEVWVNSEHILYMETEGRSTTVHMTQNLLYAVEESLAAIGEKIEQMESARIKNAIIASGLPVKNT